MSWIWLVIGIVLLGLLSGGSKNSGRRTGGSGGAARIDHPHYITEDESECSVCGARFPDKLPVCPRCGARFGTAETDEREWDEEFDEECDMDEEEGW